VTAATPAVADRLRAPQFEKALARVQAQTGDRHNLSKPFYLTGKVDVGGFGAGSDITTQVSSALGCQVTRNIYSELGFRYLYTNYEDDSNRFVWKTSTYGPQITTGIIF